MTNPFEMGKLERSQLIEYHQFSSHHYIDILNSEICGCFYCETMFPPKEIEIWLTESETNLKGSGQTALCPYCGIDSVIGSGSGIKITEELLEEMKKVWF